MLVLLNQIFNELIAGIALYLLMLAQIMETGHFIDC